MSVVAVKDMRFAYPGGTQMHFDFSVTKGERLAIMGASGSGKSTLLHLLAGFETPHSGSLLFEKSDMTFAEPASRPVSILFQDNNLFGHLTVAQNIGLGLAPRLRLSKTETEAVENALAKVGLSGLGKRLPSELSGGERQRAALARCLLRDKPILLLDEPFAALGPAMRVEMLDLVMTLQREKNLTVIMVTHNPDDAAYFATRIGFVEAGVLTGTMPARVLQNPPKDSELSVYLGSKLRNS
jgi:thiamine transport system ATP-binding protein